MDPLWTKVIGIIGSILIVGISSRLALMETIRKNERLLGAFNSAGGGVLLTIALVHLLPEVSQVQHQSPITYPLYYFFIVLGYTLLLLLEKFESTTANENVEANTRDISHNNESLSTPLVLLVTLSIHGMLEGIVFGIQTEQSAAISFLLAILLHKPVEALILGGLLVQSKASNHHYILFSVVLGLITPVGTMIGLLISKLEIPDPVIGLLTGLTIGSFLFISTTEIIADEFRNVINRWAYFVSYLVGTTLVLLLELVNGE